MVRWLATVIRVRIHNLRLINYVIVNKLWLSRDDYVQQNMFSLKIIDFINGLCLQKEKCYLVDHY